MKSLYSILIFSLSLWLSGCATLFYKEIERPHFWLAEKEGKQVYVLGTFHAFVSIHEMPDWVLKQLNHAEVLVLEVPPTSETQGALLKFLARLDRGIIYSELEAKDWQFYKSLYKESELGHQFLKRDHKVEFDNYPLGATIVQSYINEQTQKAIDDANRGNIAVTGTFIRDLNELSRNLESGSSLDKSLYDQAVSKDIVFDFLDRDLDTVVEIQKQTSEKRFHHMLKVAKKIKAEREYALVLYHKNLSTVSKLAELYRSGEPINYGRVIQDDVGVDLSDKILKRRHKAWVKHFQGVESGYQRIFIGVGAAHLYGEENFLKELKTLGYKVSRVTRDFSGNLP